MEASGFVVVSDAAAGLGVSRQRVRALLANGDLQGQLVGGTWLIDPHSLADYAHRRQPHAGRPLAPATAWAALVTVCGTQLDADVVAAFQIVDERRARVRALAGRDVEAWRWLARRRAVVARYSTRTAYLDRMRDEADVVPAGVSARRVRGLVSDVDVLDAYVTPESAPELVDRYRLRPDPVGNVVLRSIAVDAADQLDVLRCRPLPDFVIAVDLCEDRDPRTSAAGRSVLVELIGAARAALRSKS